MKFVKMVLPVAALVGLVTACGAPSPEKVCDHALGLLKKEMGDAFPAEKLEEGKKECVAEAQKEKEKDAAKYEKEAKCLLGAESMADLEKCKTETSDDASE